VSAPAGLARPLIHGLPAEALERHASLLLELVQLDAFLAEQRRRDAKPTWTDAEPNPGERTLFAYVSSGVM
jgi:hypothetical protein